MASNLDKCPILGGILEEDAKEPKLLNSEPSGSKTGSVTTLGNSNDSVSDLFCNQ